MKTEQTTNMKYGRAIEINEDTKVIDLKYPNCTLRFDLSEHLVKYHEILAEFHKNDDLGAAYFYRMAALDGVPRINLEEQAAAKNLADLQHHKDTTVGLWATDRPELFKDHPHFGLLFEIK